MKLSMGLRGICIAYSQMPQKIGITSITDFKDRPSFEDLKRHLISLYRPDAKPIFDIHNPHLRFIFQLRVGLSHLRHHKKRHKFADTPSDKCLCKNGVEDTQPLFFDIMSFLHHA